MKKNLSLAFLTSSFFLLSCENALQFSKQDSVNFSNGEINIQNPNVVGDVELIKNEDEEYYNFNGGEIVLPESPIHSRNEFTIAISFRSPNPNANYKLVSAAKWNGGCDAKGFNIGTHYAETWGENSSQCMIYDIASCEGKRWGGTFEANKWYHLAISVSKDGFYKEYVNGKVVYQCQSTGEKLGDPKKMEGGMGQSELVLGSWGGGFRFVGDLKNLYMSPRQLSDQEMAELALE